MCVYDEMRRRSWSERAHNNDPSLDLCKESCEIDRACLMEAEAKFYSIVVGFSVAFVFLS